MAKGNEKIAEGNKDGVAGNATKAPVSSAKGKELLAKNGKSKDKAGAKAKKNPKKASSKAASNEPGFFQRTKQFFREVRIELKKVTWPTRKETMAATSVVLVVVFMVATYLGIVDIFLNKALKLLMH